MKSPPHLIAEFLSLNNEKSFELVEMWEYFPQVIVSTITLVEMDIRQRQFILIYN